MRKPVLGPGVGALSQLIYNYYLCKESASITINKISTRRKVINVDVSEAHSWKEFIQIGDAA